MTKRTVVVLAVGLLVASIVVLKAATRTDSPKPAPVAHERNSWGPILDAELERQRSARIKPVDDAKAFTPVLVADGLPFWKRAYPNAKIVEQVDEDIAMVQNIDGSMFTVVTTPPVIDGATSIAEMSSLESALYQEMNEPMMSPATHEALARCGAELSARKGIIDAQYKWTMGFHWVGDGKVLRVVDVNPAGQWPAFFDDEARSCWLGVVSTLHVSSERVLDRVVEMAFCVYPKGEVK